MSVGSRTRFLPGLLSFTLGWVSLAHDAHAEKVLTKIDGWDIYTDGRVGAFVSYVRGDGIPRPNVADDGHDLSQTTGGLDGGTERKLGANGRFNQGVLEGMRVRSGFIGNTLGFGVRGTFDGITYTGYTQFWTVGEAQFRRKTRPNPPDVRQVYAKLEGPWGTFIAGRTRALFSRGATDINAMYAHRYGVGFPGGFDEWGPSSGHIGYGVLGSGFAMAAIYATPPFYGLQLTVGAFDPIQLQGAWSRTKWVRPESELTFEQKLPNLGKVVLFGNGAAQKLYKADPPSDGAPEDTTAWGFGYGGRVELGPFHLGLAGHYGQGLGLNYALEPGEVAYDPRTNLRKTDGYYVQTQLALGKVDLSVGWGITRVFLNAADRERDATGNIPHSIIKSQMGVSAGVVWHVKEWLHLDLDGFRADCRWFLGEKQIINTLSSGMTLTW
jgi:Gram-negative porin